MIVIINNDKEKEKPKNSQVELWTRVWYTFLTYLQRIYNKYLGAHAFGGLMFYAEQKKLYFVCASSMGYYVAFLAHAQRSSLCDLHVIIVTAVCIRPIN